MENIRCLRKKRFKIKKERKKGVTYQVWCPRQQIWGRVDCSNGNRLGLGRCGLASSFRLLEQTIF